MGGRKGVCDGYKTEETRREIYLANKCGRQQTIVKHEEREESAVCWISEIPRAEESTVDGS